MKRTMLIACILGVLGALAAMVLVYSHYSDSSHTLARARVALDAHQHKTAAELAQKYLRQNETDSEGWLVLASAQSGLGAYDSARGAFERAGQLGADLTTIRTGVAETYILPSLQVQISGAGISQLPLLKATLTSLDHAQEALQQVKEEDPVRMLAVQGIAGSVEMIRARLCRRMALVSSRIGRLAAAGGAVTQSDKYEREGAAMNQAALGWENKALASLSQTLLRSKGILMSLTSHKKRAMLLKHIDASARNAISLCEDIGDDQRTRGLLEIVQGLADEAPVAVTQGDLYFATHVAQFDTAADRRTACAAAAARVSNLLTKPTPESGDDRNLMRLIQAELLLGADDFAAAQGVIESVLKSKPAWIEAKKLNARVLIAQHKFVDAEKLLFVLKTDSPDRSDVLYLYAQAAAGTGKLVLAHDAMRALVDLDPTFAPARKYLVEHYILENYFEQAYMQARAYWENNPDSPDALRLLVETALKTNRRSQALNAIDKARKSHPESLIMLSTAAACCQTLDEPAAARQLALQAIRFSPVSIRGRLRQAMAMAILRQFEGAQNLLARELRVNGDVAEVQFAAAEFYLSVGHAAQAIERYRAGLELNPMASVERLALARVLLDQALPRQCLEALGTFGQAHAGAELLRLEARVLLGEKIDLTQLRTANNRSALLAIGTALLRTRQGALALSLAQDELAKAPRSYELNVLAGQACLELGDTKGCLERWSTALASDPTRLDIYLRLANQLASQGGMEQTSQRLGQIPGARQEMILQAEGAIWTQAGAHAAAAAAYQRLAQVPGMTTSQALQASFHLAASLARAGRLDMALARLDVLAQQSAVRAQALWGKTEVLAAAGRDAEALQCLDEVWQDARVRLDASRMAQALRMYARLGQNDKAAACCDDIIRHVPGGDYWGCVLKAQVLQASGVLDQAEAYFRRAISILPTDLIAYEGLAQVLDAQQRPIEALGALDTMAAQGATGRCQALLARAHMLGRWGLNAPACQTLNILEREGFADSPAVRLTVGESLAQFGQSRQAKECLGQIPPSASQYVAAQLAVARLTASDEEAMKTLDQLAPRQGEHPEILDAIMARLISGGQWDVALERFRTHAQSYSRWQGWPIAAAWQAARAMIHQKDYSHAATLARHMARQTGDKEWRRLGIILEPATPLSDAGGAPSQPQAADLLLELACQAQRGEPCDLRLLQDFQAAAAKPDSGAGTSWQALAAIMALDKVGAQQTLAMVRSEDDDDALTRVLARSLQDTTPWPHCRIVAASLARTYVALDMNQNTLASQIARAALAARPACQWAAVLAVRADSTPPAISSVLTQVQPPGGLATEIIQAAQFVREKKYREAAQAYARGAAVAGGIVDLRLEHAKALYQCGQAQQALEVYQQVRSAATGKVAAAAANNAACLVARLYPNDQAKLGEAYGWAVTAVQTQPNSWLYHDTLGWLSHLLGRHDEARLQLRLALRDMNHSGEIHAHLAAVEKVAGNEELSRWHAEAARAFGAGEGGGLAGSLSAAAALGEGETR
ncbi:MAG: hypothetical protein LLG01_03870 [Planctomycetaceae bacterium]|nr:hypothetical protein [Planctomycetaceae bacterium]